MLPVLLCLSDARLIKDDNCNALGLIPPPAGRSVSACLISYHVNYGDTCCKVSNLSLFVTQFTSIVGRFESSTGILSISKLSPEIFRRTRSMTMSIVVIDDNCNALAVWA